MKNEVKQVVLVRRDLKMGKGKIASQVAHACMSVFFQKLEKTFEPNGEVFGYELPVSNEYFIDYIEGSFKKTVLAVNSEEELLDLHKKAFDRRIHCSLIKDSGLTEFNNVPTYTTVAIGPWNSEEIDEITGHLKLL